MSSAIKMNFKDKVVLVTGGTRGIGAAISRAFAKAEAKVIANYHRDQVNASLHLQSLTGKGHAILQADVADGSDCQALVNFVIKKYGRIDILVNNAGIFIQHSIDTVSYDDWELIFHQTINVNLLGPARLMYLAAEEMKMQGGGRIVNISSRGAFRGEPDQPAYGASKAALNALGQSLAQKLGPDNIFIGTVAPGFVETDMAKEVMEGPGGEIIRNQSSLGRVATAEEVAHATLFLASTGAEFTTGAILDVNGASYLRS